MESKIQNLKIKIPNDAAQADRLSGDFIIYQPRRGQRYTTDDMLAAWLAVQEVKKLSAQPARFLDLGSGLCSVPMILLWAFPELTGTGVEISPARYGLGRASLEANGVSGRFDLVRGDLRDLKPGSPFGLVTSSPPYYQTDEGLLSPDTDKAGVRFELQGSIEDYCRTAAAHLQAGGIFTTIYPYRYRARALAAAGAHGLFSRREVQVIPQQGKPALVCLFAFTAAGTEIPPAERLVIRGRDGLFTPEFRKARRELGFPDKLT
jgi:tRNA1(Val) A37 N6-methylase TrmN6